MPDALLPNDRVRLRPQAGAHEDVLNVPQPAQLAVQQILALARAEETPRHHNFALLRYALKLAAANLQHHRRHRATLLRCRRFRHALRSLRRLRLRLCRACFRRRIRPRRLNHLARLRLRDNLFHLRRAFCAQSVFVPVLGQLVLHADLRLVQQRPLVGLRINQRDRHLGHAQRLPAARTGKDHVFHLAAAQRLGALLAQHPRHAVEDVRLAAPVGSYDHCDPIAGQRDLGTVAKGLEAQNLDFFQL